MVNGVFGAAGYRASLEGGQDDDVHRRQSLHSTANNDASDDDTSNDAAGSGIERADRMVEESGIVYGAEPIPREMAGSSTASENSSPASTGSAHNGSHNSSRSPSKKSVRVGKVGPSDLYVTPSLTFDLSPSQPHLSPEERHRLARNEPPQIRHLLGMYRFTRPADRAEEFVKQARYMADYEPTGPFDASFHAFYPVYADMTVRQLKGYFAWRTLVRHGDCRMASSSMAFVYVYELLNGIGAKNTRDAYARLLRFKHDYTDRYDAGMNHYLGHWLRDLVIAGNLQGDPLRTQFRREITSDQAYTILAHPEKRDSQQIAAAARSFGTYKAARSPLARPVNLRIEGRLTAVSLYDLALAAVWKAVVASHVTAKSYFHSRVAIWRVTPVTLFQRAIYEDDDLANHPYETRKVEIDSSREYARENGHWYLGCYEPVTGQRAYMNDLLHEVDRVGRIVWHTGRELKPRGFYPPYTQVVVEALRDLKARLDRKEWEAAHPPVHVDLSKLGAIRKAAAGTRESLLTQEEREAEAEEVRREDEEQRQKQDKTSRRHSSRGVQAPVQEPSATDAMDRLSSHDSSPSDQPLSAKDQSQSASDLLFSAQSDAPSGDGSADGKPSLSDEELFLLRSLVQGQPASAWKKKLLARHVLPSVLADSINDKLFDLVGDSVLETDENGDPSLVSDYVPDVKDFLSHEAR